MNYCDFDHMTEQETRLLPTSDCKGNNCNNLCSNIIVCHEHYKKELRYRLQRTFNDGTQWQFPPWHTLENYSGGE